MYCLVDAVWFLTSLASTPASPGSHVVRQVWGAVLLCDVWAGTSGYLLHHLFATVRPLRPPAVVVVRGIGWHLPLYGTGLGYLGLLARHAVWCRRCGWAPVAPIPSGGGSTRARRVARLLTFVVVVCGFPLASMHLNAFVCSVLWLHCCCFRARLGCAGRHHDGHFWVGDEQGVRILWLRRRLCTLCGCSSRRLYCTSLSNVRQHVVP